MDDDDTDSASAAASRPAVPVMAEATTVLLLPVVHEGDSDEALAHAPRRTKTDVDLGIVEVDTEPKAQGWHVAQPYRPRDLYDMGTEPSDSDEDDPTS
uniref:Uncharacterized protein n=1 Tax=Oryza nivara TaxID=4536 RepID=A0A0E0IPI2_ORYNI